MPGALGCHSQNGETGLMPPRGKRRASPRPRPNLCAASAGGHVSFDPLREMATSNPPSVFTPGNRRYKTTPVRSAAS